MESITESRIKFLKLALLCLLFTLILVYYFLSPANEGDPVLTGAGIVGLLFFFPCFLYFSYHICKPKILLKISSDGITDTSALISPGFIKWEDIGNLYTMKIAGRDLIGIEIINYEKFRNTLSDRKRKFFDLNAKRFGLPVFINVNESKMKLEEVMELLCKYKSDYENREVL